MKCIYHPDQDYHAPSTFLLRGQPAPSPEGPVRAELLSNGLAAAGLSLTAPSETDSPMLRKRLEQIHTPRYLRFLETIYERWQALPNAAALVAPNVHPVVVLATTRVIPLARRAGICTIWHAQSAKQAFKEH